MSLPMLYVAIPSFIRNRLFFRLRRTIFAVAGLSFPQSRLTHERTIRSGIASLFYKNAERLVVI